MMTSSGKVSDDFIPCGCGCGELMPSKTKKGKPRMFLPYHYFNLPIHQGRKLTQEHRKKISDNEKGVKHWNYKGGKSNHIEGYIRRMTNSDKRDNRILEHRLVYEEYYKCCLLPGILIHHINEDKQDNRPENLKTVTRAEHMRLHKKRTV